MSTELLDLEKVRAQPLVRDPFPFVVVSGMLKPGVIRSLARDSPPISDGGVYPVDVLPLGPSMQKLVAEGTVFDGLWLFGFKQGCSGVNYDDAAMFGREVIPKFR